MILLTGATGFVGRYVLKALTEKGLKVKCLVRDKNIAQDHLFQETEIIIGNLSDRQCLRRAVKNVSVVIHLAGLVSSHSQKDLLEINYNGTKNLVDLCVGKKIRFIYMSSIDAVLNLGYYGKTKWLAEQYVRKHLNNWIIFRPAVIYGKGDNKNIAELLKIIEKFPLIPVINRGKYLRQPIYIEDILPYIMRAIKDKKLRNQAYNLAGPSISYNEILNSIMDNLKVKRLKIFIPSPFVVGVLQFLTIFNKKFGLHLEQVKTLQYDKIFDTSKTLAEFRHKPIDFKTGLRLMLQND